MAHNCLAMVLFRAEAPYSTQNRCTIYIGWKKAVLRITLQLQDSIAEQTEFVNR